MAGITEMTKVSSKGQITIPQGIRHAFRIRAGQTFVFKARKDGILLKPVEVSVSDKTATDAWATGLKAALADVKAGRVSRSMSEKEFFKDLDKLDAEADEKNE
jgi:AbrB family looped-hinge helix DNA binding protein